MVQYGLFEDNSKKDKLRKTVYNLKDKFGLNKLMRAAELTENTEIKDVIGFGSIISIILLLISIFLTNSFT